MPNERWPPRHWPAPGDRARACGEGTVGAPMYWKRKRGVHRPRCSSSSRSAMYRPFGGVDDLLHRLTVIASVSAWHANSSALPTLASNRVTLPALIAASNRWLRHRHRRCDAILEFGDNERCGISTKGPTVQLKAVRCLRDNFARCAHPSLLSTYEAKGCGRISLRTCGNPHSAGAGGRVSRSSVMEA